MASSTVKYSEEASQTTTRQQWAWFSGGCATVILALAKAVILTAGRASENSWPWIRLISTVAGGFLVSDLVSGIYHWAIDNYGSAKTPIFGSQIVGFQAHHQRPALVAREPIASLLYLPAAFMMVLGLPINVLSDDPVVLGFVGALGGGLMFSPQVHAWSHFPKARRPAVVAALQDAGILLGKAEHAAHHRAPFDTNYCGVIGVWNRFLDKTRFFRTAEAAVFFATGVRPRSWSDSDSYEWKAGIHY